MRLSWTGARWELECTASQKHLAKNSGMHFDWKTRVWWTGLTEVARGFSIYADTRAKAKLNKEEQQISLSKALDSKLDIPVPDGLSFLPFQKAGIEYAISRPNTLNADEMGLGKTVQAVGVINAVPDIKKILIVCPAGLTLNWSKEILKWTTKKLSGDFASSKVLPDSDIVIANYEIMGKLKDRINARHWDLHIYDESHYLKNPSAKRTQAVLGSENIKNCYPIEARRKLFLTGTPILNRPVELWPTLRVIDPEGLGANFWLFAQKFCGVREDDYGRDFLGASNLDILQDRLRSRIMIRRLKKDVLKELPPKRRQIIAIPGDSAKKVIAAERDFFDLNTSLIEDAIKKAETSQSEGDTESYNQATKDLKGLRQMLFEEISRLRHDTAVAKVPYLTQHLENILEQEDKVVLFAHHLDVINPIFEKFKSVAVKFDGTMNKANKNFSVEKFQTDPKCKLFIGSITAAGVGITLTQASLVLFAELDWRPAMVTQAEDRLHRIGQKESVLVQHIVFDNSLDANMAKKIVKKQEIIDAAIG